ncbi:MAG: glycosyltransferase family 2 protein [Halanaerobiaceae bacterium]
MKITALIPAYNEENTIGTIIKTLKKMEIIDEILVVDDGSEDNTSEVSRKLGARVVRLKENQGKGAAIQKGIENINSDIALMLDGDLIGLHQEHINKLIYPVLDGEVDMAVGVFNEGRGLTDLAQLVTPNLSGQRALKLEVIKDLNLKKEGFGVEIYLNKYVKENGKVKFVDLPELTHVMKEEKMGFIKGLLARFKMYWEILRTVLFRYFDKYKNKNK